MSAHETLWAVYTNEDLTEGRGRQYVKHFCRLRSTALRLAKKGYVQGTDCPVEPVQVLVLDGQHVLPVSCIVIKQPTQEDEAAELRWERRIAAIERAKAAGLTSADIALITGGDDERA